jgi:hypothetical protein
MVIVRHVALDLVLKIHAIFFRLRIDGYGHTVLSRPWIDGYKNLIVLFHLICWSAADAYGLVVCV